MARLFFLWLYGTLYCSGPGQDVPKWVKRMLVPSGVKTLFFKLHTGAPMQKAWMEKRAVCSVGYALFTL